MQLFIDRIVHKIISQIHQLICIDKVYTTAHQKVPDGRVIGRAPEPDLGANGMGLFDKALQPVLLDGRYLAPSFPADETGIPAAGSEVKIGGFLLVIQLFEIGIEEQVFRAIVIRTARPAMTGDDKCQVSYGDFTVLIS